MNAKKVLAIAAAGVLFSAAAFAQTTDINALLAQIAQLQAQIAALQGSSSTGTSVTGIPAGYQFTAPMKIGSTGEAVKYLQMFLNSNVATQVAATGVGSKGNETMYYGPATAAAVTKYQNLNAAAILAPVGLTAGTGNFGASTMAHVNAALKTTPVEDDFSFEDDTTTDDTTTDTTSDTTEGTITATLWSSPANNTTVKGGEEKSVVGYKVKTQGGEVTLKRFDVEFSTRTVTKYAQDIALYNGSEELYRFEGISSSDLEELSTTQYRLRFPINYKLAKDSTNYFYVKVKAKQIVSATSLTITLNANGIRGVDGAGLNQYTPSTALAARTFSFATEQTAVIEVSNYPGAQDKVVQVSESGITYDAETGKINLKSKTVGSTLKSLSVYIYGKIAAGTANTNGVDTTANVAKLYDGETLLGSATITDADRDGTSDLVTFTDLSVKLEKDTIKTLTIKVDVPQVENTTATPNQGDYIYVTYSDLTGEDDNLNTVASTTAGMISGSMTGKNVHFYSYYPELTLVSATASKTTSGLATTSDVVEGKITFNVKAVGADIYVTTTAGVGVNATSSNSTEKGTDSKSLQSSATTVGSNYIVYSGETKSFTISDTVTPAADGYFGVNFDFFKWNTSSAGATFDWSTATFSTFVDEWKTPTVYLDYRA